MGSLVGAITKPLGDVVGSVTGGLTGGLMGAGGLSNNYNQAAPPITQQNFSGAIQQAQGDYTNAQGQQQQLAQALLAQVNGQGPNLANAQFQQAANQNNAQGAGAIASQKGINPALAARLIAQQTAQNQQQAAGQSGILAMQNQLAAEQAAGGVLGTQGQQALENQQIQQQAQAAQNQAITQGALGAGQINAGISAGNTATRSAITGSLLNSLGGLGSILGVGGGASKPAAQLPMGANANGTVNPLLDSAGLQYNGGEIKGTPLKKGDHPENDVVPAMLSPGEIVIPRSKAKDADKAKDFIDHLKGQKKKEGGAKSYGEVLSAHNKLKDRVKKLEAQLKGA